MMKRTLTAAALAVVLAVPAYAQTTTPAPGAAPAATMDAGPGGFVQTQASTDWLGSKLIGASVYGPDNASIGEINDVVIGTDGKINAVVVGVGGFLGVGTKSVALPFQNISVTRKPDSAAIDKITVSYTKDQLKSAPAFAYYEPNPPRATTGSGSGMGSTSPATSPMSPAPSTAPKQ